MAKSWYYVSKDKAIGPIDPSELMSLAAAGIIQSDTKVSKEKDGPWTLAGNIKGLFPETGRTNQRSDRPTIDPRPPIEPQHVAPTIQPWRTSETQRYDAPVAAITDKKRYPAMRMVARFFQLAAVISLIVAAVYAVIGISVLVRRLADLSLIGIGVIVIPIANQVLIAVSFWAIAEVIFIIIDIESNTRRSSQAMDHNLKAILTELQSRRPPN